MTAATLHDLPGTTPPAQAGSDRDIAWGIISAGFVAHPVSGHIKARGGRS